tara:strand:- start:377 stop:766 length:390 start_codon:yes stop_codon:yes gene_type:complete
VGDLEPSLNEERLHKKSSVRRIHIVLTLFFIVTAMLGGILADAGFGQHSPEKTCSDSENTLEKIGIVLVFTSFFGMGFNLVVFLVRLISDWKTSIHALILVLLHAGSVFLAVFIFADSLLSNAGCDVLL